MIAAIIGAVLLVSAVIAGIQNADGAELRQDVSNTYVMGDNDSRADGRQFCVAGAKQKALEAIGTVVEAEIVMTSGDGPGDRNDARRRIRSYVAAQVGASIDRVDYGMDGSDRMVVHCFLTVTADPDAVRRKLAELVADAPARRKLDEQQAKLERLQAEVARLGTVLETATMSDAATAVVRGRRIAAETEAHKLERSRADIVAGLKVQETSARGIAIGMTTADVYAVAGAPRAINDAFLVYDTRIYAYGGIWVTMFSGAVRCVTKRPDWNCADESNFIKG